MYDFIRGYFDGDGSIYSCKENTKYSKKYSFNITGNDITLLKIQNILVSKIGLKKNKLYKRYKFKTQSSFSFTYSYNKSRLSLTKWCPLGWTPFFCIPGSYK